jgi:hypothetical protein
MILKLILIIIILFMTIFIIAYSVNKLVLKEYEMIGYENYYNPSKLNDLRECQVPTLNTEQCYKSRYYECPIINGTYLQCTNNYIPKPNVYNADCGNRTFDMTPYPWKISENCYYNKINFDRNKEFEKVKFI